MANPLVYGRAPMSVDSKSSVMRSEAVTEKKETDLTQNICKENKVSSEDEG